MKPIRPAVAWALMVVAHAGVMPAYGFRAESGEATEAYRSTGKSVPTQVLSGDQAVMTKTAEKAGVNVQWDAQGGVPLSIRGRGLGQRHAFSGGKGLAVRAGGATEQNAMAVLDNLSRFYGFKNVEREFRVKRVQTDRLGFRHMRMRQMHQGLRVVGGELILHFDAKGEAYEVNGSYVADIQVAAAPRMGGAAAVAVALADQSAMGSPAGVVKGIPELVVLALKSAPQLAYELTVSYAVADHPGRWRYWVDAENGTILLRYNDIQRIAPPTDNGRDATVTGSLLAGEGGTVTSVAGWHENGGAFYLYNQSLFWYVYNIAASDYPDADSYAWRGTSDWGTSDGAEISLGAGFNWVQQYWLNVCGRHSFDNANAYAGAYVHEGSDYVNAYWDGENFHFGDGDGVIATSLAVLDVAGHEYGHAVTEYTANLNYAYESGALNESFSDIAGACVEFYAQPDGRALYPGKAPGQADWLCGEDAWLESTALRDLRNPMNTATVGAGNEQPSRYHGTFWYYGDGDNGGVHHNSGVQNFVFYLLSDGGSGNNDGITYNVTGIGWENAAQVAFRALTVYCTPTTEHRGARDAWRSAAQDLNPAWVSSVEAAWDAVGLSTLEITPTTGITFSGPVGGPFTPAGTTVYALNNTHTSSIGWSATADQPWVAPDPAGGTLPAGGAGDVTVALTAAAAELPAGIHEATVTVVNVLTGTSQERAVTLTVLTFPKIAVTPLALEATLTLGGQATQTLNIANLPEADGTLDFSAMTAPDTPWLTLSPAGGTGIVPGASLDVAVQITAGDLITAGLYHGEITISSNDPTTPELTVPVTLTVLADDLVVTPDAPFAAAGQRGGPYAPASKAYTLTNTGAAPLDWTAAGAGEPWLSVTPAGGTLAGGESIAVTVALTGAANVLPARMYTDTVSIINPGTGAVQRRGISLDVQPPPPVMAYDFPLDTDPGWTVEGGWAFGVPTGGGSSGGDPVSGHTGQNVYGYNLDGDYPDGMPPYFLTTTALDFSACSGVMVRFWRWLGIELASYDHANVQVSNDGVNWTTVWEHTGKSLCDGAWQEMTYDLAAVADGQPTVYVRWGMGPTDDSVTYPGWNLDDIAFLVAAPTDDLLVGPPDGLVSVGYEGGPFTPPDRDYTLTNAGTAPLDWTAAVTQPWLDVSQPGGTLGPGESRVVTVSVNTVANALSVGIYDGTATFRNTMSGRHWTWPVGLTVEVIPPKLPTVTTQAVSDIGTTTATGNGNATDLGVPNPTAHGVCWTTTGTPTVADSRTDEGATSATGAFTGSMTGLSLGTLYRVRAYATNAVGTAYGDEVMFTTKAMAPVTLGNLAHTYDGTAKAATATTDPDGLAVGFTYDGTATLPVNAGNYAVVATVNDANYAGTASGTLVIGKAGQAITFAALADTAYGAAPVALSAMASSGQAVTFELVSGPAALAGSTLTLTGAGTVTVRASQAGDANWNAAPPVERSFTVAKAMAPVTLGNLAHMYDGTAKAATATTDPDGLAVGFTYDGAATLPVNAGSYAVVATVNDANYAGTASGTLVIGKAGQAITFAALADTAYGAAPVVLSAMASSGLAVTFELVSGPAALAGSTLTLTGAGAVTVRATQTGDANRNAATPVARNFTVVQKMLIATAENKTRSFGAANPALTVAYAGLVAGDTVAVLEVPPTAACSATATSGVGTYPITVSGGRDTNYAFSYVAGTLTITVALPTVTTTAPAAIGTTTATSGGNVTSTGGAAVTARGVCWSTAANPTLASAKTTDGTGPGVFASTLTTLSADTTCYVRAYATNRAGTGYGEQRTFTTPASTGPDVVVTSIVITPVLPAVGGKVTATVTVLNQGTQAGKGGKLHVWVDKPEEATVGEPGDKSASVSTLEPGASKTVRMRLTAPQTWGTFTLRAFIDAENSVKEDDEYNNQKTYVYDTGLPDFEILAVQLTPELPFAGKTFTAYVTVTNSGEVAGNGGYLELWADCSGLATPPVPGPQTKGNKYKAVDTLQPGAMKTVTVTGLKAPADNEWPGLGVLIDSRAKTLELDEDNNWFEFDYECQ